jgi:type IV pilus assembly protein PilQ
MRKALRATAVTAALLGLLVAGFGCASSKPAASATAERTDAATPPAAAAASPAVAGRILEAAYNQDSDGARVVLTADVPIVYTSYEPRPDLLVFDLPKLGVAESFRAPQTGGVVESVRVEPIEEMGKSLTRVSIQYAPGTKYEIASVGQGLAVAFSAPGAAADPEPVAPTAVAAAAEPVAEAPAEPAQPSAATAEARVEIAHFLEEIHSQPAQDGVTIALLGDGAFRPRDFTLENPPRVVIDLPGVTNQVKKRVLAVEGGVVSRVRVSQYQVHPEPITRIVLDLSEPTPYRVEPDGERLSVLVGHDVLPAPASAPVDAVAVAPAADPAPAAEVPAPAASVPVETVSASRTTISPEVTASAAVEPPPPAPAPAPASTAPAAEAAAVPIVSDTVRASQIPAPVRGARTGRQEALFEAAAAVLEQQEAVPQNEEQFRSRTLLEGTGQFTGEPISLDLKDADIKDVFRTVSELTGLNIVVDPEVRGTVTVKLEDVPWDQALDLILKQNGLGYVLENNIMRIATTAKLQAEQSDRARLAEARQAAEPTRTVLKKLSYGKAADIVPTLKSIMSRRGDIVVDARTNTLIIREIPTYMPAVLQLIDSLDTATPQVMIESRIVETTKTLGRQLGINWGFNAVADAAHGNTTGLVFPNTIDSSFRVPLANGPTIGSIRLGNILDTFNLDIALSAAENQGLLKIISSPKVTALTNTPATVQSGVQIPVQTTVNNTTTVIYVDATLRLTVTPQITAQGTIMLDVQVQKREPAVALNLTLGQNVPLTIREYRGSVLVRDGATTVVGGIFQINDQDQNNMIPGLWKIPVLGHLFKNKTRREQHDELLIFITPRILRS